MRKWWAARSTRTQAIMVIVAVFVIGALFSPKTGATPAAATASPLTSAPIAAATTASVVATTAKPAPTTATPPPQPTPFSFGDGKKLIPTDIPPGMYRMRAASAGCYWERLSGLGGTIGEILANGNPSGPEIVTIAETDKAFNSSRCGRWSADLSAITASPTNPFGAGTFIVGVDIAPGTWRSAGGTSCYWQRMQSFGGGIKDILANENAGESTIVTISASDKGFSSSRCGTWTKIG